MISYKTLPISRRALAPVVSQPAETATDFDKTNEKERVPPDKIRGCRRQQETVREIAQAVSRSPTSLIVGARPMCPPAWRGTNPFHTTMGTNEPLEIDFSTTKNTKPHESKNGGGKCYYPSNLPDQPQRLSPGCLPTCRNRGRLYKTNKKQRVPPDEIRGCRRQQETVREITQLGFRSPTCLIVGARPMCPPAWRGTNQFHTTMGTDEPLEIDFSTTKNTKPHESKNGGEVLVSLEPARSAAGP
ncbi:hypothetical protein [Gimesia sp.]|uniref:hypothetical protein n=1 Tax=Gimesia sp. TaxID=2024833 RepID=UPI003A94FAEC